MASQNIATIKDLAQLGASLRKPTITIIQWKHIVKDFAERHGLTDREAIDLARIAKEHF